MLPATNRRVACNTSSAINQEIESQTRARIDFFAARPPQEISRRLRDLDHEWDIERALECNASAIALSGVILAATTHRRWLLVPGLVTGFLLQHALQGWCPPLPLLRRAGFRTAAEINEERYALKALRGDFQRLNRGDSSRVDPDKAYTAARQ
jgi:hypothetical protein